MVNHQKGAALIVTLVLLVVSLMLGVSSMQAALIDERLAGNYRAAAQAQMAAEEGASLAYSCLMDSSQEICNGLEVPSYISGFQHLEESLPSAWDFDAIKTSDGSVLSYNELACANVFCKFSYVMFKDELDGRSPGEYIISMGAKVIDEKVVAVSRPVFVKLDFGDNVAFGATNFIGGIAEDAEVQWPSSKKSKIAGGAYTSEDGENIEVPAVSLDVAEKDTLTAEEVAAQDGENDKAGLTNDNVISMGRPSQERINTIKYMYESYLKDPALYPGVNFVTSSYKVTGKSSLRGLYIVLSGDVQIGGNADLQGALIVANIEDVNADEWLAKPSVKAKFNGGGNKGTVWFDEAVVKKALQGFGLKLENFWGKEGSPMNGQLSMAAWN